MRIGTPISWVADDGLLWFGYVCGNAADGRSLVTASAAKIDSSIPMDADQLTERPVTTVDAAVAALDVCSVMHESAHTAMMGQNPGVRRAMLEDPEGVAAALMSLHERVIDAEEHWCKVYADLCISLQPEGVQLTDEDVQRLLGGEEEH